MTGHNCRRIHQKHEGVQAIANVLPQIITHVLREKCDEWKEMKGLEGDFGGDITTLPLCRHLHQTTFGPKRLNGGRETQALQIIDFSISDKTLRELEKLKGVFGKLFSERLQSHLMSSLS